ncbi:MULTISPECIES: hypothetical protein [Pseudomonas syringae group]|uniref:Uncharacterized protein n=3 Tax=Pseudomonas syringae group TaxID=136849 RepID=A0AAE6QH66_9PSED|nr:MULTISPECIES: hypothetical protein [Pseudomonas syringae group]KOP55119.1 hypothetical protein OX88_15405 [Pseudomonas coronafaciens pv. porri]KOP56769.1 hypothetical protein OX90_16730 [Pseudomonas coronafaciens pv. porri]KPY21607.1 Uncharacterized protein ALO89_01299 [Pseudomonas coronafaciens pv. porri]KPZ28629.1 Uncharacterized protein ALO38_01626 [Pseudomonas coronafaciens pv. zizaniae]MCF5714149.1 hypothetical protein [Pseudomonas tremae]
MDKKQSTDVTARVLQEKIPKNAGIAQESPPREGDYKAAGLAPAPSDISDTMKPPVLPGIDPEAISEEQAYAGITIHIPGSVKMCWGDEIRFYWGKNLSSTTLFHRVGKDSIVRVLCVSYNFTPYIQFGLVDLYYELYRDNRLIGTSPVLRVNVNYSAPATSRQRQRKRLVNRRFFDT